MPEYVVNGIERATSADGADRIISYLLARGYADPQVQTSFDPRDGSLRVRVETDRDPTTDLLAYTSTPTARETFAANALADAIPVIRAIAQKPRADRTPVERALLGLAVFVREVSNEVGT